MKKIYLSTVLLFGTLTLAAQSKIDPAGMRVFDQYRSIAEGQRVENVDERLLPAVSAMDSRTATAADPEIGALVTLAPGADFYSVDLGGRVQLVSRTTDRYLVVSLPVSLLEEFAGQAGVEYVSIGEKKKSMMKYARPSAGVDAVHAGTGLPQAYKGKGVVVGIMDTGIDPNHINFRDAENYADYRVKEAYAFTGSNGVATKSAVTTDEIKGFTTDLTTQTHGTHCIGIAAGAFNGNGLFRDVKTLNSNTPIPYYGVAPEADIVMSGGYLYDSNIISGVTKAIEYAETNNMPVVVNLSLGSLLGEHDGTSSVAKQLAELGKRGIICIATGNDGDLKCAVTFSGGVAIGGGNINRYTGIAVQNAAAENLNILLFSSEGLAFNSTEAGAPTLQFVIYDTMSGKEVYSVDVTHGLRLGGSSTGSSYEKPEAFTQAFSTTSSLSFSSGVLGSNGKGFVQIQGKLVAGTNSLYKPALKVGRPRTVKVFGFCDETTFTNTYNSSSSMWVDGTTNGSVSAMATAENVIAVGAYTSQVSFGLLDAGGYSYNGATAVNEACGFSSYGINTATGENLPLLCAPGSVLISSVNTYWRPSGGIYGESSALATVDGNSYYWAPMQGTSMATPFVTGTVALFLQADPDQTVDDIKSVLAATASKPAQYTSGDSDMKARWGNGKLDALAGVKEVLARKASIGSVWSDPEQKLLVEVSEGAVRAYLAGEQQIVGRLYSTTGALVGSAEAQGDEVTLATGGLTPGIYVLAVEGADSRHTRKIVVR